MPSLLRLTGSFASWRAVSKKTESLNPIEWLSDLWFYRNSPRYEKQWLIAWRAAVLVCLAVIAIRV